MTKIPNHRLCVYCGSSPGTRPEFMEAANALGVAMAEQDIGLVYGGGGMGLMGEVARGVLSAGGHVTGIIPEFLVQKERMLEGVSELIVTRTMHERKMLMFEKSTGFVALPGGIGTLEELAEILTWSQLKQHARPVIVCNIAGFWDGFLRLIQHMRDEGFIRTDTAVNLDVANTVPEVISTYFLRRSLTKDIVGKALVQDKL